MPDPQLTTDEIAALLNQQALLKTQAPLEGQDTLAAGAAANLGPLAEAPVPPMPPDAQVEPPPPPPPPDPNDPHTQYMEGAKAPPPPQAPLQAKPDEAAPVTPAAAAPAAPASAPPPTPATPATPPPAAPGKIVSTKPEWYEAVAPPPTSPIPGVIGGVGLGILGALLARKSPGVAAGMGGLGALTAFQSLADAPHREFENKLSTAERQGAMHAKINGGADSAAELERLRLAQERIDMQKAENARKAAEATALGGMNTPETIKERQIASNLSKGPDGKLIPGGLTDQQLAGMNGADIRRWRTALQNQASQARGMQNNMEMHDIRTSTQYAQTEAANAEADRRRGLEQQNIVEKEQREVERGKKRAQIGGWEYIGEGDPSTADTNGARNMAGQVGRAVRAARELKDLSTKVKISAQAGGLVYQAFGSDQEQKRIINRMKVLQNILGAAQREIFHQGVPQQFEMAINSKTNPEADSLRAVIEGTVSWEQLEDVMRNEGVAQMYNFNYVMPEGADLAQSGVEPKAGPRNFQQELAAGAGETGQMIDKAKGVAGQVAENVTGTAKQVGAAVAPAAQQVGAAVQGVLKKIKYKDAKTGQWMDGQKSAEEIKATIEALTKKGLDPSQYIQVSP